MLNGFSTRETVKHAVLILGAIIVLLPFYVMLTYSFKSPHEIMTNTGGIFGAQELFRDDYCIKRGNPVDACMVTPFIYNYVTAFSKAPLLRYLMNGLIVTGSIFVIQVVVALPCAYALAKLRFWGREAVFGLVLFCLLIPVHAIALPLYIMLAKLGLTNSYAALVIPWTISVFGIFLMRQFFMTVPDDLIDAARMDGMSEYSIIWNVMLPTAIPALMAFAIFSVVAHWNDYFWPRIVITGNRDLFTPPLGLREFKGDADGDNFGPMMASAVVIVMPLIVAFMLAQRRFIEGITLSGMK
ncbi:carbohydrate ABC transporter permease [Pacificibacter marinus]|uniref:L-arabinose transport system permease protein AraQ n=1 Tax=Pacificibacter marinus TaxID=658057 RepID=A0A1Y5RD11_9RHOB|nr:carbohydrate ABC transporter permease [Pacificibacter marinus]SEK23402.1 carbohydrate ABC transporter membrane protein 2, CUT1 family [Pacificibacter marinus]SLN14456.1 L-arabinose transport system permease protein AraQ [Pacificibacter marinus]